MQASLLTSVTVIIIRIGQLCPSQREWAVALWGGRLTFGKIPLQFRCLEGVDKCLNNEERIAVQDMNGVNLERFTVQGITQGVT